MMRAVLIRIGLCAGLLLSGGATAEYAGEIAIPLTLLDAPPRVASPVRDAGPDASASRLYLNTRYDDALGSTRMEAGVATTPPALAEVVEPTRDIRLGLHCDLDAEGCRGYGATLSYGRLGFSVDPAGEEGSSARIIWRSSLGF